MIRSCAFWVAFRFFLNLPIQNLDAFWENKIRMLPLKPARLLTSAWTRLYLLLFFMICFFNSEIQAQIELSASELNVAQLQDRASELAVKSAGQTIFSLPDETGVFHDYEAVEDNFLSDELQKRRPDFRSFQLRSIESGLITGRLSVSMHGINAIIHTPSGPISIHRKAPTLFKTYIVYNGLGKLDEVGNIQSESISCTMASKPYEKVGQTNEKSNHKKVESNLGSFLRTFRLALVTTGEFTEKNGGSIMAETIVFETVDMLNGLYRKELGIEFDLVGLHLYKNKDYDPFEPKGDEINIQAAEAVHMNFDLDSYDIGHTFHKITANSTGHLAAGGRAELNSVCDDSNTTILDYDLQYGPKKAAGFSGQSYNQGFIWLSHVAHEFGHMFGARHTYNGKGKNCKLSTHSLFDAVEIGSGTTIMSYSGSCSHDNNLYDDGDYFHLWSLCQIKHFLLEDCKCGIKKNTKNSPPRAVLKDCTTRNFIPVNTPFILRGEAYSPANNELLHCWEQIDEDGLLLRPTYGLIGENAAKNDKAPLFRSYRPGFSNFRYFPDLELILENNYLSSFEPLPQVERELNFGYTVRDYKSSTGKSAWTYYLVQVSNQGSGDNDYFSILFPNGQESFQSGTSISIEWNTAGTSNSPILCSNVNIYLSVDGGYSFPYYLGAFKNNGKASVDLPLSVPDTKSARIKLSCNQNPCLEFFDVSDENFGIVNICEASQSVLASNDILNTIEFSNLLSDLGLAFNYGVELNEKDIATDANSPRAKIIRVEDFLNQKGCQTSSESNRYEKFQFKVSKTGSYNFYYPDVPPNKVNFWMSVFKSEDFDINSGCPHDVILSLSDNFSKNIFFRTGC